MTGQLLSRYSKFDGMLLSDHIPGWKVDILSWILAWNIIPSGHGFYVKATKDIAVEFAGGTAGGVLILGSGYGIQIN